MGKQTWQSFTQPLYLVFTHHCSSDNKEPRTATACERPDHVSKLTVFKVPVKHSEQSSFVLCRIKKYT